MMMTYPTCIILHKTLKVSIWNLLQKLVTPHPLFFLTNWTLSTHTSKNACRQAVQLAILATAGLLCNQLLCYVYSVIARSLCFCEHYFLRENKCRSSQIYSLMLLH